MSSSSRVQNIGETSSSMTQAAGILAWLAFLCSLGVVPVEADQGVAPEAPGTSVRTETQELLPADGVHVDHIGDSVAVWGQTAVVGAPGHDGNARDSGAAYVFVRTGNGWIEQAKLLASDGDRFDRFGDAVAIMDDTVVVGAPDDEVNGHYSGSVYVFVRDGATWTEEAKLLASDGAAYDAFGTSVAVFDDTLVVGAFRHDHGGPGGGTGTGAAYVFVREGSAWREEAELRGSDSELNDGFGFSVALWEDTIVSGAALDDDNGQDSGSAYVFLRAGTQWSQQAKLLASDGEAGDRFGVSVAVEGDALVAGAMADDGSWADSGSAYVFVRNGALWTEEAKLLADDGRAFDYFGISAAIAGDQVVIGAHEADAGAVDAGAAYVFVDDGTAWTPAEKLVAEERAKEDYFGISVAAWGNRAVVGASWSDRLGPESGAAYVFEELTAGLGLAASGACPGMVTVTVSNAPPNSEVGVIAAANTNGFVKGGSLCNGLVMEIGEPFELPPTWVKTDGDGNGEAIMTLDPDRCWLEAVALASCETSVAIRVP